MFGSSGTSASCVDCGFLDAGSPPDTVQQRTCMCRLPWRCTKEQRYDTSCWFLLVWDEVSLFSPSCPWAHIYLPLPPECWYLGRVFFPFLWLLFMCICELAKACAYRVCRGQWRPEEVASDILDLQLKAVVCGWWAPRQGLLQEQHA